MIGSLRGTLLDRADAEVLLEVAGVGYRVAVTPSTAVAVGDPGGEAFLWVHHLVREDHQALYGFGTKEEREAFEALLGAHGVGPALALAILAVHPPASLRRVLAEEDLAALCLVPGVGKKTAARLLVELTNRLGDAGADGAHAVVGAPGAGAGARGEVREALAGLGYGPDEVSAALRDLPEGGSAAELLRAALQRLAAA